MRSFARAGLVILLSGVLCLSQSKPPRSPSPHDDSSHSPYTLTLTPSTNPMHLGEPLEVTLAVTNISNSEIFWRVYRPYPELMGFRFLLTKDGKEVETTLLHRVLTGRQRPDDPTEIWSGSSIILPKTEGTFRTEEGDLRRLYVVMEPGEYILEVSRFEDGDPNPVRSNKLTLKIIR